MAYTPPSDMNEGFDNHYTANAPTPKVLNINIGNLANFSDTKVAGSADERELLAAMEEKIANAARMAFNMAQASLNLEGGINGTSA